ncbi:MAG: uridine monophosphate kinase [Clostridia bacterium]|nr:uridine monophosphate kinase [Clostridia bacterium]
MPETNKRFHRVLLKLSGEAIAKKYIGEDNKEHIEEIFDPKMLAQIADVIKRLVSEGIQVGVVIGAGNIWRGAYGKGVKRARADQMGMLGTMINCLRLEDAVEKAGVGVTVMSPVAMNSFAEQYNFRKAIEYLEQGKVVIFGAGLGIPFITTDTTVVVRGAEIDADIILCAKNIDGIYVRDPRDKDGKIDRSVPKYKVISYDECMEKDLKATDVSASALADAQKIDMYVFALSDPENIIRAVNGEEIGTLVTHDASVKSELYEI